MLQDLYHYRQDKGEYHSTNLQWLKEKVAWIINLIDELVAQHFKTQLYNDEAKFFDFLRFKDWCSMVAMISIVEQFQRTEDEIRLCKEKTPDEQSHKQGKADHPKVTIN